VLEIGIGSRLNLPFYSHDVQRVYGVDPSVELQRMARKKRASEPIKLEFLAQSAENDCHSPIRASIPLWSRGHCAPFRTLPKHYSK
jgi:hypothetical protein